MGLAQSASEFLAIDAVKVHSRWDAVRLKDSPLPLSLLKRSRKRDHAVKVEEGIRVAKGNVM